MVNAWNVTDVDDILLFKQYFVAFANAIHYQIYDKLQRSWVASKFKDAFFTGMGIPL